MKKLLAFLLPLALTLSLTACGPRDERKDENAQYSAKPVIYLYPEEAQDEVCDAKPVAYLYPQTETEVTVRLDYDGKLTCTYPAYADGWTVSARPDGTLTDKNGQTYRYLYWEGISETEYDFTSGFCVPGSGTAEFLEDAFQHEAYTESARLTITPEPDTLIRVFMAFKPLSAPVEIAPQTLTAPARTGFTAVEWGGAACR